MRRYLWLTLLGILLLVIGALELLGGHSNGWQRVGLGTVITLSGIALGRQQS